MTASRALIAAHEALSGAVTAAKVTDEKEGNKPLTAPRTGWREGYKSRPAEAFDALHFHPILPSPSDLPPQPFSNHPAPSIAAMIAIAIAALVLPGLALAAPAPVARQTEVGTSIRWQGSSNECLTVEIVNGNANVANGTPLVTRNCAGAAASVQNWVSFRPFSPHPSALLFWCSLLTPLLLLLCPRPQIINRGAGKIRLANSNFCLDAGINPRNNQGMKVRLSLS